MPPCRTSPYETKELHLHVWGESIEADLHSGVVEEKRSVELQYRICLEIIPVTHARTHRGGRRREGGVPHVGGAHVVTVRALVRHDRELGATGAFNLHEKWALREAPFEA